MLLTKTASAAAHSWANVGDGRTLSWAPGIEQEGVDVRAIDINEIQRRIACNMDRLNTADMRAKACEPRGFRWRNMRTICTAVGFVARCSADRSP
jgi:hypothetical protein